MRCGDIEADESGAYWAATSRGLVHWVGEFQDVQVLTPDTSEGMPAQNITALALGADDILWVGFRQEWDPEELHPNEQDIGAFKTGGLARYDVANKTWLDHFQPESDPQGARGSHLTVPSQDITSLEFGSDGILWIGSQPYFGWDDSNCDGEPCANGEGYWLRMGGGLTAHDGESWSNWYSDDSSASCYPAHVTSIESDGDGRVWVGTVGRGLLHIQHGMQVKGCAQNFARYFEPRRSGVEGGLKGNTVWSVDIADDGRVYIGTGDGGITGVGIAILDHRGTFNDSTACECNTDDDWLYLDFENISGDSNVLISHLEVLEDDRVLMGTINNRLGDGEGLRVYKSSDQSWQAYQTSDTGLQSNQITSIAEHPSDGSVWVGTHTRGVARFDGQSWQHWRMFARDKQVAEVTLRSRAGYALVEVDVPDLESFNQLFPELPARIQIGSDPTFYSLKRYREANGDQGPFFEISPKLSESVEDGTPIFSIERGPASDSVSSLSIDIDGLVWVGGRETIWMGSTCSAQRLRIGECWLDGGVSRWNGSSWFNYDYESSEIPDQEVQTMLSDQQGRLWVGTGNGKAEGDGIGVLNPSTNQWTLHDKDHDATSRAPRFERYLRPEH